MTDVRSSAELRAEGWLPAEVSRQVRRTELSRVRRGAYVSGPLPEDADERHRQLVAATLPVLADDAVVSHRSAAVVHGLRLLGDPPARVEVTRPKARGGRDRGGVHAVAAALEKDEVVRVDGLRVTSLARTVVDLGRTRSHAEAVVTGDAALSRGLEPNTLAAALLDAGRRPGVAAARRVAAFLDGRSESAGESLSRVLLASAGVPAPDLQVRVLDGEAEVARCDFGWPELRTVGEFDGRIKYGRLLRPGETAGDVVWREKLREDRIRDLGWEVVRWVWADLDRVAALVRRLERAFARAAKRL